MKKINQTTTRLGNTIQRTTEVEDSGEQTVRTQNFAERIIGLITGVIITLLSVRFVLSLLGANEANGFAQFIYNITNPLVRPFFSLFKYDNYVYGVARFETFTIVAILVYALLGWLVARIATLNRD